MQGNSKHLMVNGNKLFLKLEMIGFLSSSSTSSQWKHEEVARMVLVVDDIRSLIEATLPGDHLDDGEVSSCDGPDNVHHFLQSL